MASVAVAVRIGVVLVVAEAIVVAFIHTLMRVVPHLGGHRANDG